MKTIDYFLLVISSLIVFSCSEFEIEESMFHNSVKHEKEQYVFKTPAEANSILIQYVKLNGDEYSLNLSQKDAENIGIPADLYLQAKKEIDATNSLIKQYREDPNHIIELTDPSEWNTKSSEDPVEPMLYHEVRGTLRPTTNNRVESTSHEAPMYVKGVRFYCYTNAAILPVYTCETYSSGFWTPKSKIGRIGTNTKIEVPLTTSNCMIRVAFTTSDTNGGTASYSGYIIGSDE